MTGYLTRLGGAVLAALCLSTPPALAQDSTLETLRTGDAVRGWAGVGRLEIEGKGFCTAALITDRLVLTAAHCLFDRDGGDVAPDRMAFAAGFRDGRAETTRLIRRAVAHPAYNHTDPPGPERIASDLALLELQQPIRGTQVAPFALAAPPQRGEDVGVLSYAVDRPDAPALQKICDVLDTHSSTMVLSCDVNFGSSGAPVFSMATGTPQIVGVVTAKATVGSRNVAISAIAVDGYGMLEATLAARASERINALPGQATIIAPGERNDGIGAKFIRP